MASLTSPKGKDVENEKYGTRLASRVKELDIKGISKIYDEIISAYQLKRNDVDLLSMYQVMSDCVLPSSFPKELEERAIKTLGGSNKSKIVEAKKVLLLINLGNVLKSTRLFTQTNRAENERCMNIALGKTFSVFSNISRYRDENLGQVICSEVKSAIEMYMCYKDNKGVIAIRNVEVQAKRERTILPANNRDVKITILRSYLQDDVARDPNADHFALDKLAASDDLKIVHRVAGNPNASGQTIGKLLRNGYLSVRVEAVKNRNARPCDLKMRIDDPKEDRRVKELAIEALRLIENREKLEIAV